MKLQAAIKYGEEDLAGAQGLVEQCPADDPDSEVNMGCLLFKVLATTIRIVLSYPDIPDSLRSGIGSVEQI